MPLFPTAKAHLREVKNYIPGKPLEELEREYGIRNALKMASNENALGPSPKAMRAAKLALTRIHRYPEGGSFYLRQKLAKKLGVRPENLVFGNGSDEILVLAARAFVEPADEVVIADPTFLIYEIASQVERGHVVKVRMKDFHYDLDGMRSKINERTKLVFIANPDNPVGTYISHKDLGAFLEAVPSRVVVVLDEAYHEFAASCKDYPRSLGWLTQYPNLVITRTFSKAYGLAGLRIGYAVTSRDLADTLNKVREPFNINLVAQAAALAALDDTAFLQKTVKTVASGRKQLSVVLRAMGVRVIDTVTNFVLADLRRDAAPVYEALLRKGVIVRPMGAWGLSNFIRVTVGQKKDNQRFLSALRIILKK